MRSAATNPFEPGSDRVPVIWAGRIDHLTDFANRVRPRRTAGMYERGRVILGEPGIGKSVLAGRITSDAKVHGDWVTPQIRIPRGVDPFPLIASAVLGLADQAGLPARQEERIGRLLTRVREISLGKVITLDTTGTADATPAHVALTSTLTSIGETAVDARRLVVLHLDEVQNITDVDVLSQLLVALGDTLAATTSRTPPGGEPTDISLPVAVYLTGLPEFAQTANTRFGATFTRRFKTDILGPIDDDDLQAALQPLILDGQPVLTDDGPARVLLAPEAARRIIDLCLGDPFLFQLAGQHAWDADPGPTITRAHVDEGWAAAAGEARRHVARQLDRLPDLERRFIEAMAALPGRDRTATRIARALGYDQASQIGTTTARLEDDRGLILRGKPYTFRVRTLGPYLNGTWP